MVTFDVDSFAKLGVRRRPATLRRVLSAGSLATVLSVAPLQANDSRPLGPDEFEKLHEMVVPQAGESRWMEIDWYPGVWEARQRAAVEGKPILLMAGSGGAPVAGC